MCYSTTANLKDEIEYAKMRDNDLDHVNKLVQLLKELETKEKERKKYFANGFGHPKLMVFTDADPMKPQMFTWGLIPAWTKTEADGKKFWNNTLNARGETIWEKPSFRGSAKSKRCLIYVDSFFESHHQGGKTYPFRIHMKDESPISLAGLWDEWVNKDSGEVLNTVTIVTTSGNPLMAKIHNNPKAEMGPRMPVILPKDKQDEWLIPCKTEADKKHLMELIKPFDESLMAAHTVINLFGPKGIGNKPEAIEKYEYPDLELKL